MTLLHPDPSRHPTLAPAHPAASIAGLAVNCYQCGKCSAGCPVAEHMDRLPHQLVRLAQLGRLATAMRAQALWQCVSCQTCTTRCPQRVDCAGIMDALREQAARQTGAAAPARQRTIIFQQEFLRNIRRNGRLDELELIAWFKARSFMGDFNLPLLFKDALLAPQLMRRGKFQLRAGKARDRALVGRIFERCMTPGAGLPGNGTPGGGAFAAAPKGE